MKQLNLHLIFVLFVSLFIVSCNDGGKESDTELLEKNVRSFFFLGDTVEVMVAVTDTLRTTELNEMITTVDDNFRLIQLDIDTLRLMIDDWSYKAMDLEKQDLLLESKDAKIKSLEYRLKLQELETQKQVFVQTSRILNRLRRSVWADIAGFDAKVEFVSDGVLETHILLLDANYNIVD